MHPLKWLVADPLKQDDKIATTYKPHIARHNIEIGLVLKFHNAEENLQNWKEKPNQTGGVIFVNGASIKLFR